MQTINPTLTGTQSETNSDINLDIKPDVQTPFIRLKIGQLAEDIIERHHVNARQKGHLIQHLLAKHQNEIANDPDLQDIHELFAELHAELLMHMLKEESVLFRYCKELETATTPLKMHCGTVKNPVRVMSDEHQQTQKQMQEMETLLARLTPIAKPDPDKQAFYHKLKQELNAYLDDLKTHMQLEDVLLFPATIQREAELNSSQRL